MMLAMRAAGRFALVCALLGLTVTPARADTVDWTTEADVLAGALDSATVDASGVITIGGPSDWYDAAWGWRSPVTVTEQSGRAVADYSVQVTVDTATLIAAGQLEADARDLRFVDALSGDVLGYWIEDGVNTASTLVWVMVPAIAASGAVDLWMYHGNPAAADDSNKSDAMLWWDDFTSGSLAAYESQGRNGDGDEIWAISGSQVYNTNNIYSHASLVVTGLTLGDDFIAETTAQANDDDGIGLVSHLNGDGSNYYCVQTWESQSDRNGICRNVSEGPAVASGGLGGCCEGETHKYEMISVAGQIRMIFDGSQVATYNDGSPLAAGRIGLQQTQLDPPGYFDYLQIRRYVEPEPSALVGAPEAGGSDVGTWTSDVVDGLCGATTWQTVAWSELLPAGADVELQVRTGPTATPDGGWSPWSAAVSDPAGSAVASPDDRYGQLLATLSKTDDTPELSSISVTFQPPGDASTDFDGDGDPDCSDPDDDNDGDPDVTDCEPFDFTIYTDAEEACDAIDSDCDGDLLEAFDDSDGDLTPDCAELDDDNDGDPDLSDCAPLDASIGAGAAESCDDIDSDCDGDFVDGYDDTDGDLDPDCTDEDDDDDGFDDASDCDPTDDTVYPGAPEGCLDGIDQDCDGSDLSGIDDDGDSWGAPSCGGSDCDDGDASIYPGAPEVCGDGIDQDCDGIDPNTDDVDGDLSSSCNGDCDDDDPNVYPGAEEICNDVDDDCDLLVDEGLEENCEECDLADLDADGWTLCDGDCDDEDDAVYPESDELCDGVDNDCDGVVPADEADEDGDGFRGCEDDCDDLDPDIHPDADEICDDGIDQNCTGGDLADVDSDGDGVGECDGDCDDDDPDNFPGNVDICDGRDNDCDGVDDPEHLDIDEDGFDSIPCGGADCDDLRPDVHPDAEEWCGNGVDEDCDGDDPTCVLEDPDGGEGCDCAASLVGAPAAGLTGLLLAVGSAIRRRRLTTVA